MGSLKLAGRFEILDVLNRGAYGITYLAKDSHQPSQPNCVVKELLHHDPKLLSLFHKEAQTLEKLGKHPCIPKLLAYFDEGNKFYIAQAFITGHNLSQEIYPGRKLSESYVLKLLKDILSVLAFVHQHRVIHQDIKPANLIRQKRNGDIFLIDFGVIKKLSGSQISGKGQFKTTAAIGTRGYIAPEQDRGKPCLASDLYAVGMVAIAALTGVAPHQLSPHPHPGKLHWQSEAISLNPALAAFITRLVDPNPKRRYPSALKALADLNRTVVSINVDNDSRRPILAVAKQRPKPPPDSSTGVKTLLPIFNQRVIQIVGYASLVLLTLGISVKSYQWGYNVLSYRIRALQSAKPTPQGYTEATPRTLVNLLEDGSIQSHPDVVSAFWAMATDARTDGVFLYPLAGYMSIAEQQERLQNQAIDIEAWLRQSDYHTGYAIAIADYNADRSTDWDQSFEQTPAFRWLKRNANRYGFELSYPKGNPAGEKEPWHWRYNWKNRE